MNPLSALNTTSTPKVCEKLAANVIIASINNVAAIIFFLPYVSAHTPQNNALITPPLNYQVTFILY